MSKSDKDFEKIVVQLFEKMGYGEGKGTQYTKDGGIDGIINEDALGLSKIYIQAKKYTNITVGRPDVQKFVGAITSQSRNKGIFITTSSFSKEAKEYIKNLNNISIKLIDGNEMAQYIYNYSFGMEAEYKIVIKKINSDFWDDNYNS